MKIIKIVKNYKKNYKKSKKIVKKSLKILNNKNKYNVKNKKA
jgi:hypothetical protein